MERDNFEGEKEPPIVKYGDILTSFSDTAEPIKMQFGNMRTQVGRRNHVFNGVQSPDGKGQCEGETGQPVAKYSDSLP